MRLVALILLGAGAVMLATGTLTDSWGQVRDSFPDGRYMPDNEYYIRWGLTEQLTCYGHGVFGGPCLPQSFEASNWPTASAAFGRITLVSGIAVSVWLAIALLLTALRRPFARLVNVTGMVASALALVPAALFTIFLPPFLAALDPSLGSSFWLYLLGGVLGIAGTSLASRDVPRRQRPASESPRAELPDHLTRPPLPGSPRPARPTPVPLPPPPVVVPRCPTCDSEGRWLHEHRRFACARCNQLLQAG